jgi:hypothetical protein
VDKGAHFFRCDFQVHTPRDQPGFATALPREGIDIMLTGGVEMERQGRGAGSRRESVGRGTRVRRRLEQIVQYDKGLRRRRQRPEGI